MRWALIAAVLLAASGCISNGDSPAAPSTHSPAAATSSLTPPTSWSDTPNPPGPSTFPPSCGGDPAFQLEPGEPVLRPGEELTLQVRFNNTSCNAFERTRICWNHPVDPIRIGVPPLHVVTSHPPRFPDHEDCATMIRELRIEPGESYEDTLTWNGSFRLVDHRGVGGAPSQERLFWAAAGEWPLAYGWAEYEEQATLRVQDTGKSQTLPVDGCRLLEGTDVTMGLVEMAIEPEAAANKTVRTVSVSYTLNGTGCWITPSAPSLVVLGEPFHGPCMADAPTLLDFDQPTTFTWSVPWDGGSCMGGERGLLAPGTYEMHFAWHAFGSQSQPFTVTE